MEKTNINIELTRKNIKNIILKITPDGKVLLSAPKKASEKILKEFLTKKESWIREKLKMLEERKKGELKFETGEILTYLGNSYNLEIIYSDIKKIEFVNNKIYIYASTNSTFQERKAIFENWAMNEFALVLEKLTRKIGEKIGHFPNEIKIKNMKSRWGSCIVGKKIITYNLQLIYKPLSIIEYVVLHEMSHILYPNHQKEFWNFVEKFMPDWKKRRELLKK